MSDDLILGAHFSIAGGLHNALLEARRFRCRCAQLFVANQRQWRRPELVDAQVARFMDVRRAAELKPLVAHSSYLINLAAADPVTRKRSLHALRDEYARCRRLGIEFLIIHPGAHMGQGESRGMRKIASALDRVVAAEGEAGPVILLETTAGQGTSLGRTFAQLKRIMELSRYRHRLAVCMDTCHVFAAGYDIRDETSLDRTMASLDREIGLEQLKAIHVNDSKAELGSRVDRHEHLGKGKIGAGGFRALVRYKRLRGIPLILETPKGISPGGRAMDALNLARLRRWRR